MSKHDYLLSAMIAVLIMTNFLGLAFTIRRLHSRAKDKGHELHLNWFGTFTGQTNKRR
jgi:hypothetical protein